MKLLDNIVKYSSLVSILIIFLSYLGQFLYYSQFNIDITNYISFSEFIVLFLKESIYIICLLLLAFLFVLTIKYLKILFENIIRIIKIKSWLLKILILILLGISYFLMIKNIVNEYQNPASNFLKIITIFSTINLLLSCFMIVIVLKTNISIKVQLISGVLFAVIITSALSFLKSHSIRNQNSNMIYEIRQENKTIITDKNLVRIGQTEKYIFLFDKIKKTSFILKTDNIKEILIYNKTEKK